ncbi:MAG TPA: DapH/DapD/GlmU-related protein [Chryseolinea sp.]|nr:DapH/DapD/GlmU-related protein [Chryseolinea sp.]HPH45776.1 DapH/DapD/GlmU-related protein [Chryseolinea sp.]HPM30392.1 DapH/DapD/GlmU-related protein [Chryseolinea sp.]
MNISKYLSQFNLLFPDLNQALPWSITTKAQEIILSKIKALGSDYTIVNDVAIHKTAIVEEHVITKGPIIISANCFVGAHAYLRGGVYLAEHVSIGPGCEVKSSFIMSHAALGHFNFVGDSILGSNVNMEAGSVIANHFNERDDKTIFVTMNGKRSAIEITKFGALVGDHSRIGANAVLSPGTILQQKSIVKRLELVE